VRLVSAMRLARRKRPFALLQALARALEIAGPAGEGVTLTIAGAGPLREALERRAGRLGIGDRVVFAGWLDRPGLRALYRRSDLFLMPSVKESFCIAALEARATGLPVIGMACTGMTDFIRDGENGEMAADDADMAARLAALLSDRGRLAALAADRGGLDRFAWKGLTQEHIAFYGRVAARHSGST
jgi:glycosyltransferase involved in cell wall biosynthesis